MIMIWPRFECVRACYNPMLHVLEVDCALDGVSVFMGKADHMSQLLLLYLKNERLLMSMVLSPASLL